MLALTVRLLLTFYWLRAIKSFFNMNVYATQSQKPASIIASTTISTEQWLPLVHLNRRTFTKILTKSNRIAKPPSVAKQKKWDRKFTNDSTFALSTKKNKLCQPEMCKEVIFSVGHWGVKMMVRNFLLNSKERSMREKPECHRQSGFSWTDKT